MRRSSFLLVSARRGGSGGGTQQKLPLTRLNVASERAAALAAMRSEDAYRARYRPTLDERPHSEATGSAPLSASMTTSSSSTALLPAPSSSAGLVGAFPGRPSVAGNMSAVASGSQFSMQRLASSQSAPFSASSSSSSSTRSPPAPRGEEEEEEDSSWAFGGGASSRGGPRDSLDDHIEAHQVGHNTPNAPFVVHGSAGKNAVPNYGKRRRDVQYSAEDREHVRQQRHQQQHQQTKDSRPSRDEEIAGNYTHEYAPTSRSKRPLPHHTYFSSPSSSFNDDAAATATGAGPVGVGGPRSGLGMGAGMLAQSSGARASTKAIAKKKTALILPGQGSQYVAMSLDIYRKYRSARHVWNVAEEALLTPALGHQQQRHRGSNKDLFALEAEADAGQEQRTNFEQELSKSMPWDTARGLTGAGTAVARSRRGWLRDLVFSGDQLDLTRAENAQPSILVSSLSILSVLKNEFPADLISRHIDVVAGHGLGIYAALCATGRLDMRDAVRLLRHRGLTSSHYVSVNKTLFPEGCEMPESIYETWAFANAGSGKGAELLTTTNIGVESGGVPPTSSTTDAEVAQNEKGSQGKRSGGRGWKRSQMSGCMIRPGKLRQALACVERVSGEIQRGEIENVGRDEVVEVANINSSLQIVLSGTRVGVSLASDRLRAEMLGARAVNLPVSGPYHSSIMTDAANFLRPAIEYLPLRESLIPSSPSDERLQKLDLVSSCDGSVLEGVDAIRTDLSGALAKPVMWLESIETMLSQGVQRFICLGPGRACAHLLSKELAHRDQIEVAKGGKPGEYEVWSITSVEDVEQLAKVFTRLSQSEGDVNLDQQQTRGRAGSAPIDDNYVAL